MSKGLKVHLTRERFPQWQKLNNGYFAGHVHVDDQWLSIDDIQDQLNTVESAADLSVLLQNWNGFFALILETQGSNFMACDIARSIPLFWHADMLDGVTIKDQLAASDGIATVWQQEEVLVQAEFVPGHASLRYGWQQLQAGEILEITSSLCYLHTYFDHRRTTPVTSNKEQLEQDFSDLIVAQTKRLISWANGRTIVVPLSGGYDSRIILAALKQLDYPALKAFTYGQEDSTEAKIARQVCETLEIDWQFVPYTPELLAHFGQYNWTAYTHYAGNLCSIPQDQDYFALAHLRESGWLEAGSIICPGYCGDVQAGSYLPGNYFKLPWRRTSALQEYLYNRFVRYPSAKQWELWKPAFPQKDLSSEEEVISELESWVLREYLSKFIINGVRAYEWFDCAWYLPLWDHAFIRFWQGVPNNYREGMRLYREVLKKNYFDPLNISYTADQQTGPHAQQWIKDLIPAGAKKQLKSAVNTPSQTNDINGLHQLIPKIQKLLDWPKQDLSKSLNEMLGHWYLSELKKLDEDNSSNELNF